MSEAKKEPETLDTTPQEEAFFAKDTEGSSSEAAPPEEAGAAMWEEEEMWGEEREVVIAPKWQPLFPLLLAIACAGLMYFFFDDFLYSLSPRQPIDLGSAADGCSESFYKKLRHNRLVRLRDIIPQPNLTAQARIQWSKRYYVVVLGCDLIVSLSEKRYRQLMGLPLDPSSEKKEEAKPPKSPSAQALGKAKGVLEVRQHDLRRAEDFALVGRLMRADATSAADTLRRFYSVTESMPFTPRTHILYDGELPQHQWWIWVGYILLGSLLLYNLWRFFRDAYRQWWPHDPSEPTIPKASPS